MKHLLIVALLGLTACSGVRTVSELVERHNSPDGKVERERREEARIAEQARLQALQENLGIGSTTEEFRAAWGEPDREESRDGKTIWRYDNNGEPRFFAFKDNKLVEHWYDDAAMRATASERARQRGSSCYTSCHGIFGCTTRCSGN